MKKRTKILTILNSIYVLIVFFFLLSELTSFEVKNQAIKSFVYFGLLSGTPILLIWNLIISKSNKKMITTILPILMLIGIFIIGPMKILYSSSTWKTQIIKYQNGHLNFKKVEFQMQDVGALGYNKRTVEVIYLTNVFMLVSNVEKDIEQRVEWVKVDKEVNELGLKNP